MDNHHVNVVSSHMSCGIGELYGITADINKVLYAIASRMYHPARGEPFALIVWSDLPKSNGYNLAEELNKLNSFGIVQWSHAVENPKTSNVIICWVWHVYHETFKAWYIKERVERAKKL